MLLVDVAEPARQQALLGHGKRQPRHGEHDAGEVAADREEGAQRHQNEAGRTEQFLSDVDQRRAAVRRVRDDRDVSQHDQEVEYGDDQCRIDECTRQCRRRVLGLAGDDRGAFEADEGIDEQQRRAADVLEHGGGRGDQRRAGYVLQTHHDHYGNRYELEERNDGHRPHAGANADEVGPGQRPADGDDQ